MGTQLEQLDTGSQMTFMKKQMGQMRQHSEDLERKYQDALEENQRLSERYKELVGASGDCEELRAQNQDLLKRLQEERELRRVSIQKAKEAVSKAKEDMASKMGKVPFTNNQLIFLSSAHVSC